MNGVLLKRGWRDARGMLIACCALMTAFLWLRGWVSSVIEFGALVKILETFKVFSALLPVPIEQLASPLGRMAFSYEEGPVVVLTGLWAITRGTDVIAGQLGAGTMEMLLAQPLRRISVVASHTAITVAGAAAILLAAWCGTALGLASFDLPDEPSWTAFWPATLNMGALIVCVAGISTLASAVARTRTQAVALVIGFYVVQLALMVVGRLAPKVAWLEQLTILSAYEPTKLTLLTAAKGPEGWSLFVTYNAVLLGVGAACWAIAATLFCRRDVPAPL
ncbi:MAG: ABC transporter permease subunit [Planctomycetales bacterium]|nr:ABC transporter permease subunit [Planctomycetales bacterium]